MFKPHYSLQAVVVKEQNNVASTFGISCNFVCDLTPLASACLSADNLQGQRCASASRLCEGVILLLLCTCVQLVQVGEVSYEAK